MDDLKELKEKAQRECANEIIKLFAKELASEVDVKLLNNLIYKINQIF